MKKEKNMLIAFLLNLSFSVLELVGGAFSGSVAIISDAVHDFGDAISIGISYFMEKASHKQPDEKYTYGYVRFSLLGGFITVAVLIFGSVAVIFNAVRRLYNPVSIDYDSVVILALIGVCVNLVAAFVTRDGKNVNQKAVNLHMIEDVLGWIAVLVGAIIMKFTGLDFIDPLMSVAIALFILVNSLKHLKTVCNIFLEKIPEGYSVKMLKDELMKIENVKDVHHIHLRNLDEKTVYAEIHIVTDSNDYAAVRQLVRKKLIAMGINHSTIETEAAGELCSEERCTVDIHDVSCCCHCHH